jgi:hypothetical protein
VFEKLLGVTEAKYLNEIITDFDAYLETKYPTENSRFKQYLIDIKELEIKEAWKIDRAKLLTYRSSNLFEKYDKVYADSIWFNGTYFKMRYPDESLQEELIPLVGKTNSEIDSIITALRDEPKLLLKESSKFYSALDSIKQADKLIIDFLHAKQAVGDISLTSLADGLLSNYSDTNEYFAKRIFIVDRCDFGIKYDNK